VLILVGGGLVVGCSSTENGRTTRVVNRPATENDTPFGGGFSPSQHPGGDPFAKERRRSEIRFEHGADNGAPETRVGGNGDARLSR
jgi:hypothetical protein